MARHDPTATIEPAAIDDIPTYAAAFHASLILHEIASEIDHKSPEARNFIQAYENYAAATIHDKQAMLETLETAAHDLFSGKQDSQIKAARLLNEILANPAAGEKFSGLAVAYNNKDPATSEENRKKHERDAVINYMITKLINDQAFIEDIKNHKNKIFPQLLKKHSPEDLLSFSDQELDILIKNEDPHGLKQLIREYQKRYPDIPRAEIEKQILSQLREQIRHEAQIALENRAQYEHDTIGSIAISALIPLDPNKINPNSPEEIVKQIEEGIARAGEHGKALGKAQAKIQTYIDKYGPDPELTTQIEALENAFNQQVNMNVFFTELKIFIENSAHYLDKLTPEQIMVKAMMNEDLMSAFNTLIGGSDGEKWKEAVSQAASALGLSPQQAELFLKIQEEMFEAAQTLNKIKKELTETNPIITAQDMDIDGIPKHTMIFRNNEGNFVAIHKYHGTASQITNPNQIAAIELAEAEGHRIGTPDEAEALTNAIDTLDDISLAKVIEVQQDPDAIKPEPDPAPKLLDISPSNGGA